MEEEFRSIPLVEEPTPITAMDKLRGPVRLGETQQLTSVPTTVVPEGYILPQMIKRNVWLFQEESAALSDFDYERSKLFNFAQHVPERHKSLGFMYAASMNEDDINTITDEIDKNIKYQQLLSAYPIRSIAYSAASNFTDPLNFITLGAGLGIGLAKGVIAGIATGAATGFTITSLQEMYLNPRDRMRTEAESQANILTAGLLGGAFGAVGPLWRNLKTYRGIKDSTGKSINQLILGDEPPPPLQTFIDGNPIPKPPSGPSVSGTDLEVWNIPARMENVLKMTPSGRLSLSPFTTSKWVSNTIFNNYVELNMHQEGRTLGPSVEQMLSLEKDTFNLELAKYNEHYLSLLGIESGPAKGLRAAFSSDWNKATANETVWSSVIDNEVHDNPQINAMAGIVRNLFDKIKQGLIEIGDLDKDVKVRNAGDYGMIVFDRNKMTAAGGPYSREPGSPVHDLYLLHKEAHAKVAEFKMNPWYIKWQKKSDELYTIKENLETSIKKYKPGMELKAAKERLKEVEIKIDMLNKELENMVDWDMLEPDGGLLKPKTDEQMLVSSEGTVATILDGDGTLTDLMLGKVAPVGSSRMTKARTVRFDQKRLMQWHEKDPVKVMSMAMNSALPRIALGKYAKRNGYDNIEDMIKGLDSQLTAEYNQMLKGATSEKARGKLKKQWERDKRDIAAAFKLVLGTYGNGPNTDMSVYAEIARGFKQYNNWTLLGSTAAASISDVGAINLKNSIYEMNKFGLKPFTNAIAKANKRDLRQIALACEGQIGMRIKAFSDTDKAFGKAPSALGKITQSFSKFYGDITLINQWNSGMHHVSGSVSIGRTIDTIQRIVEGKKVSVRDRKRLAVLGIDERFFKEIYRNTLKNVDEESGGFYAGFDSWDLSTDASAEAMHAFMYSIRKDVEGQIIKPGLGDVPLATHTTAGGLLLHLKQFPIVATSRFLIPAMQNRGDYNTLIGMIMMLAWGYITSQIYSFLRGEDKEATAGEIAWDSIDRSGLLAIFAEAGTMAMSITNPNNQRSRYKNRNPIGKILGPNYGLLYDILDVSTKGIGSAQGAYRFTTKDAQTIKRLVPLQNLFYLRQLNDELARQVALKLGARDRG